MDATPDSRRKQRIISRLWVENVSQTPGAVFQRVRNQETLQSFGDYSNACTHFQRLIFLYGQPIAKAC